MVEDDAKEKLRLMLKKNKVMLVEVSEQRLAHPLLSLDYFSFIYSKAFLLCSYTYKYRLPRKSYYALCSHTTSLVLSFGREGFLNLGRSF